VDMLCFIASRNAPRLAYSGFVVARRKRGKGRDIAFAVRVQPLPRPPQPEAALSACILT
jgi:hypothetical protein